MAQADSWHTIYPAYINSNRKVVQGRRLGKEHCVADPFWKDIADVLAAQGEFRIQAQPTKIYTRELTKESPHSQGRILYQYSVPNPQLENKKAVLRYVAEMIPQLKNRVKPPPPPSAEPAAAAPSTSGAGGKKKKGKK